MPWSMKRSLPILLLCLFAGCATAPELHNQPDSDLLIGTWKVDLRPTPSSPPYFKELVVVSVTGKSFTGSFYDTPIEQARINTDWGAVRIAFVTRDGSGDYNHSAVLSGNKLEGLSNSTGRNFLSYWSAVKQ
jgi:hypothetical protein